MNTIDEAAQALEGFANGPGAEAANALADVFEQAGDRIARSFERAASSGELSFNALAESVLSDLASIAVTELITKARANPAGPKPVQRKWRPKSRRLLAVRKV